MSMSRIIKITARFLHTSKKSQRKQYNYDLDSLIEWKNETSKVFGPVRSITKTGKFRKTKKDLDPEVVKNLKILSELSSDKESFDDSESSLLKKVKNKKKEVTPGSLTSDNILSFLPYLDVIPPCQQTEEIDIVCIGHSECSMNSMFNTPPDLFMTPVLPFDEEQTFEPIYIDDNNRECELFTYNNRVSKDDIFIPTISPIPTSETHVQHYKMMLSENCVGTTINSELPLGSMRKASGNQNENMNSAEFSAVSKVLLKRSNYGKATGISNRTSEIKEKAFSVNVSETEISIPKIKPIPSESVLGVFSFPKFQTAIPSESALTDLKADLPFQPPESFHIILKTPLFPKEHIEFQSRTDSQCLQMLKTDVEQMSLRVLPSVKSILNKTMSDINRYFLNRWRDGLIEELGEKGFKKHQETTIKNGVNLHSNIMEYLSGKSLKELQIMPDNEGHWCSLQSVLAAVCDVKGLEVEVSHSMLLYRGVFDCLAHYKDMLCLIDWKTSKKPRPLLKNTYDDPVQVAAYIGALNSDDAYLQKYGPIRHGMLVVAYPDGSPAHVHVMKESDCEQHWQIWTERLYQYYQMTFTEKMAANAEKTSAKKQLIGLSSVQ